MEKAVKAVHTGDLTLRKASLMYNVPRSTLHDRVSGRIAMDSRPGRQPFLTMEEEEELVSFLLKCATIGYAHTRKEVLILMRRIVDSKGLDHSVTDNWWRRFRERHPQITLRTAMPLSQARAMAADEQVINEYFDMLEDTLVENGILDDPHCIYNLDETGMPLNPKVHKVVDRVGAKHPSHIAGQTKEQITVLACTSAAGMTLPPFVIFDRQTLNPEMIRGEIPGSIYGLSAKGWINQELFEVWFMKHFLSYAPSTRPLLLLLDGHSSHYCPEVIRMASENQIIVFALPPHTTHLTQPLDKSAFASLKVCWKQVCHQFHISNPNRVITRYDFCKLLSEAWYQAMTVRNITAGFKVSGIYPFNRNVVLEKLPNKQFSSFNPESVPQSSGLAYVPLYSPAPSRKAQRVCKSRQSNVSLGSDRVESSGSDYDLDACYISSQSQPVRSLSKFLRTPIPPSKRPTVNKKSCGKVLTSLENMQLMEAREAAKKEKARLAEERKKAREEKAKNKASKAGK